MAELTTLVTRAENLPTAAAAQKLTRDEAIRRLGSASNLAKSLGRVIESGHLEAGVRRGLQFGGAALGGVANGAARSILTRRGVNPVAIETTPITYVGLAGIALAGIAVGFGPQMGPMLADTLVGLGGGMVAPDLAAWTHDTLDAAAARQAS